MTLRLRRAPAGRPRRRPRDRAPASGSRSSVRTVRGKSTLGAAARRAPPADAGTIRLAGGDPARLPARGPRPRASATSSRIRSASSSPRPSRTRSASACGPTSAPRVDDLMDRPRAAARARSATAARTGCPAASSAASRSPASLVRAPGPARPRRADVRPGPARPRGAARDRSRDRVAAGAAVVAATHDERFVAAFADRIVAAAEIGRRRGAVGVIAAIERRRSPARRARSAGSAR